MTTLNKPRLPPCECGRGRTRDSVSGLCSACDPSPTSHPGRKDRRAFKTEKVASKPERKAQLVCKVCVDLPHVRPRKGCPKCGKPHGEMPVTPARYPIGSSAGWAT